MIATVNEKSDFLQKLTFDEATVRAAKAIIARDAPDYIIKLVLYRCAQLGCDPLEVWRCYTCRYGACSKNKNKAKADTAARDLEELFA